MEAGRPRRRPARYLLGWPVLPAPFPWVGPSQGEPFPASRFSGSFRARSGCPGDAPPTGPVHFQTWRRFRSPRFGPRRERFTFHALHFRIPSSFSVITDVNYLTDGGMARGHFTFQTTNLAFAALSLLMQLGTNITTPKKSCKLAPCKSRTIFILDLLCFAGTNTGPSFLSSSHSRACCPFATILLGTNLG